MEWLDTTLYGNTVRQWAIALAVGIGGYAALRMAIRILRSRLGRLAETTRTEWDDILVTALARTKGVTPLVLALYVTAALLKLAPEVRDIVQAATVLTLLFQAGLWLSVGLGAWLERYTQRELEADRGAATTVKAMGFIGNLLIWVAVLLVALDNLGIEITALVAGLGVGGVAVALAVQNVLGDLFASLSIVLDRPFVLGDFVIVDNYLGNIEHIGFKTTRIRSLWGEQVVFSNSDLLGSRLRNFGRMAQRRIAFDLGVTYQTPRAKLEKIPQLIRESVEAQGSVRFDRSHFKAYGDFALIFETVYYVLSADYGVYMDIHQGINLAIHERFEREGIEFAYPTQTVFLAKSES
jgi:small-conductance mechanosensitive channel